MCESRLPGGFHSEVGFDDGSSRGLLCRTFELRTNGANQIYRHKRLFQNPIAEWTIAHGCWAGQQEHPYSRKLLLYPACQNCSVRASQLVIADDERSGSPEYAKHRQRARSILGLDQPKPPHHQKLSEHRAELWIVHY